MNALVACHGTIFQVATATHEDQTVTLNQKEILSQHLG